MKKLTFKQFKKYLESKGEQCPFCHSTKICYKYKYISNYFPVQFVNPESAKVTSRMECQRCKGIWKNIYILSDIEVIKTPNEPKKAPKVLR